MHKKNTTIQKFDLGFIFFLVTILSLNYVSLVNELIFHFMIEILTIIIGSCIFAIIWTIRKNIDNSFYTIFATGLLFTAVFDLLHVLTFEGMNSMHEYNLEYSFYFWVMARFLLGLTFVIATTRANKKININIVLISFALATILGGYIISLGKLPPLFNANNDFSMIRIGLEIFVIFMYLISLVFLYLKRESFTSRTVRILFFSILLTICSEIIITLNTSSTNLVSVIGLNSKIIAYILFFRIILATGITKPQEIFYYGLQENRKQLQDLINNLNDGICIIDNNDQFQLGNPATERIFGVKKGNLTKHRITDFLTENSIDIYQNQKRSIEDKKTFSGVLEIVNFQKENRSLFITASPQINKNNLIGSFAIIHDYTIRQKEVDKLEEAKRYYQTLFMDAPIRIWENNYSKLISEIRKLKEQGITDFEEYFKSNPDKVKEFARLIQVNNYNKLAEKVYSQNEIDKNISSPSDIFWEESYPSFINDLIAISKGETTRKYDMTTKTPSGEILHNIINWSVVPGFEKDYSRVIVFVEDITKRKMLEKQLQSQARFPEENPNPVMRISKIGKVIYSNQGSRSILEKWNCEDSLFIPGEIKKIIQSCLKNNVPEILEVETGKKNYELIFCSNS